MKTDCIFAALLLVCLQPSAHAQENKQTAPPEKPKATAPAAKPKPTQEELEAKFRSTLTKATFIGRWSSLKDGQLSPEKEDKYTILGVSKLGGDVWIINARIQYGKKDITAPIPVQVKSGLRDSPRRGRVPLLDPHDVPNPRHGWPRSRAAQPA